MLPEEIAAEFKTMGLPGFRAKQVFSWLSRGVRSFDEMTDLSKDLRAKLADRTMMTPIASSSTFFMVFDILRGDRAHSLHGPPYHK